MGENRQERVAGLVDTARGLIEAKGLSRASLGKVLACVQDLAADPTLWNASDFPSPEEGERQARYLITEQLDQTFALYLNVMRPGKRIPPHNHTTWACIAAVEGCEINYLYDRLDDGKTSGHADIREREVVRVEPGSGVALMPDDIHSVEIRGDAVIRHLHFYGRALETLNERLVFDTEAKSCKVMSIGVQTRR